MLFSFLIISRVILTITNTLLLTEQILSKMKNKTCFKPDFSPCNLNKEAFYVVSVNYLKSIHCCCLRGFVQLLFLRTFFLIISRFIFTYVEYKQVIF